MVKRDAELSKFRTEAPCGGVGHVDGTIILDSSFSKHGCELVALCVMPEGSVCGVHLHTGNSETYYILEGIAKVIDDGEEVILKPGDSNHCPDGHTHSIENIGTGDLKYIAVKLYSPF